MSIFNPAACDQFDREFETTDKKEKEKKKNPWNIIMALIFSPLFDDMNDHKSLSEKQKNCINMRHFFFTPFKDIEPQ